MSTKKTLGFCWVVDEKGGLKSCGGRGWHGREGLGVLIACAVWFVPCCIGRGQVFSGRCLEEVESSGILVKACSVLMTSESCLCNSITTETMREMTFLQNL